MLNRNRVFGVDMALKHVGEILKDVWKELEEFNKRFDEREKSNGQSNVLPTSDAGTRTVGTNNNTCCGGCEKQNNTKLGE